MACSSILYFAQSNYVCIFVLNHFNTRDQTEHFSTCMFPRSKVRKTWLPQTLHSHSHHISPNRYMHLPPTSSTYSTHTTGIPQYISLKLDMLSRFPNRWRSCCGRGTLLSVHGNTLAVSRWCTPLSAVSPPVSGHHHPVDNNQQHNESSQN